jgi:hypothetical protein
VTVDEADLKAPQASEDEDSWGEVEFQSAVETQHKTPDLSEQKPKINPKMQDLLPDLDDLVFTSE